MSPLKRSLQHSITTRYATTPGIIYARYGLKSTRSWSSWCTYSLSHSNRGIQSKEVTEEARETRDEASEIVCFTGQTLLNHGNEQLHGVTLERDALLSRVRHSPPKISRKNLTDTSLFSPIPPPSHESSNLERLFVEP